MPTATNDAPNIWRKEFSTHSWLTFLKSEFNALSSTLIIVQYYIVMSAIWGERTKKTILNRELRHCKETHCAYRQIFWKVNVLLKMKIFVTTKTFTWNAWIGLVKNQTQKSTIKVPFQWIQTKFNFFFFFVALFRLTTICDHSNSVGKQSESARFAKKERKKENDLVLKRIHCTLNAQTRARAEAVPNQWYDIFFHRQCMFEFVAAFVEFWWHAGITGIVDGKATENRSGK